MMRVRVNHQARPCLRAEQFDLPGVLGPPLPEHLDGHHLASPRIVCPVCAPKLPAAISKDSIPAQEAAVSIPLINGPCRVNALA